MGDTAIASERPPVARQAYWKAWIATLLFFGGFYTLLVPLPGYLERVGLPDWQIGLVLGAFGVASLIGRPLAGLAADRWGTRPVLLTGAAALLVGAAAVPLTRHVALLFALRLCQAAGYVAFTTAGTALVIRLSPAAVRGQRLAVFGAAANVAISLVPAAMGRLLASAPLEASFLAAGAFALCAGGLALRLDAPPIVRAPGRSGPGRLRRLALPMLAAGLFGAGFAAFFQFAPLLFARRGGLPPEALYAVYGVGIIATRVVGGRLLDRLGIAQVVAMASGLMAAGLGLLAVATPPVGQIMAVLLVAAGSGLSHPALLAHHAALLPAEPGGASAAFYIGFDLGLGLGSALFGAALQLGGLGGLYGVAAALSAGALPLAPSLARQLRPTSSTVP